MASSSRLGHRTLFKAGTSDAFHHHITAYANSLWKRVLAIRACEPQEKGVSRTNGDELDILSIGTH